MYHRPKSLDPAPCHMQAVKAEKNDECLSDRVTLTVALPLILTSLRNISSETSSQILHLLASRMAGLNNLCHPSLQYLPECRHETRVAITKKAW